MILTVAKQLRSVPYVDMMELAGAIAAQLNERKLQSEVPPELVAAVLSSLIDNVPALSQTTINDEKILREVFSRKRTLTVQRKGHGWELDCSTLPGSQVLGQELRSLFGLMLDQIITLRVLSK